MDNDDKVTELISRKTDNFFENAVQELKSEKVIYDLEKEFAKTKHNKKKTVPIAIGATIVVVGLAVALMTGMFISTKQTDTVKIAAFEELNLKDLLDGQRKLQARVTNLQSEVDDLVVELGNMRDQIEQDRANQLEINANSDLSLDEKEAQDKAVNAAANKALEKLKTQYDEKIKIKQEEMSSVQLQIANSNTQALEAAKKQQEVIDSQQKLFELEKANLVKDYEDRISAMKADFENTKADLERQKRDLANALKRKAEAEKKALVALYNPTFTDDRSLVLLEGSSGEFNSMNPIDYPEAFSRNNISSARLWAGMYQSLDDFLYLSQKLRIVPYINSIPATQSTMEYSAFAAFITAQKALEEAALALVEKEDEIAALKAKVTSLQGGKASASPSAATSSAAAAVPSIVPVSSGREQLVVWYPSEDNDAPMQAYYKNLAKGFSARYPNIDIKLVGMEKAKMLDASNLPADANAGLPEVIFSAGGRSMGRMADAGLLLDMTLELKDVPSNTLASQAMTWKGRQYGVSPFVNIAGVFYNQAIFAKLGLKIPTTLEELEKVADTLVANKIVPFASGAKDKWPPLSLFMYLVNRYGGDAFDQVVSRKAAFTGDAFVQAAQKYQDWVKKGYFGTNPNGESYDDATGLMAKGKVAMMVTGSWVCSIFSASSEKIGFFAFPVVKGGLGKVTDIVGGPDGMIATKAAENKRAEVSAFLRYAMSFEACFAVSDSVSAVPSVKTSSTLTSLVAAVFAKAKTMAYWWDMELVNNLYDSINEMVRSFFSLDVDVKKALAAFNDLVEKALGKIK